MKACASAARFRFHFQRCPEYAYTYQRGEARGEVRHGREVSHGGGEAWGRGESGVRAPSEPRGRGEDCEER